MSKFFIRIYDFFASRKRLFTVVVAAVVALLLLMVLRLRYSEDIFDFLPLDGYTRRALSVYQDVTGANKIYVLFSDADAIEPFEKKLLEGDGSRHVKEIVTGVDYDKYSAIPEFIYSNIPLMLNDSDYLRMERLLSNPDYAEQRMEENLMSLSAMVPMNYGEDIGRDPLGLFSPVMKRLAERQQNMPFDVDDGYIYTQGGDYAVAVVTSPYGSVESEKNGKLVEYVSKTADEIMKEFPGTEIFITGAPVIAVENANRIRKDSVLAICIAALLIILLLYLAFRNVKSLVWIVVTICFGWLFGMAFISLFCDKVSILVLGVGCTIIGIAVNYPLHFMAHGNSQKTPRDVLREIVSPLLIGNITTIGAFACLIPLNSTALRDLGIFAAFMLGGTILFVLIFLPQMSKRVFRSNKEYLLFGSIAEKSPDQMWLLPIILVVTCILGYYSFHTKFDSNIQHINYISDSQKDALERLNTHAGPSDSTRVYVVSEGETWDEALEGGRNFKSYAFISPEAEQTRRIALWREFVDKNRDLLTREVNRTARNAGFAPDAFSGFYELLDADYSPKKFEEFELLTSTIFSNSFTDATGKHSVVEVHDDVKDRIEFETGVLGVDNEKDAKVYAFDFENVNHRIARSVSDEFNYICLACGVIVFVFLWLTFGKLRYAIIAFLPMAIGWIWIMGLMYLFDIEFNIVNVILASFIFGQGDDYTIFIVDGLISERIYGRKVLPTYRNSILISALIMFFGIGSLIVSQHPALHSLAEVTIIGMSVVVLMAWVLPPLLFTLFIRKPEKLKNDTSR